MGRALLARAMRASAAVLALVFAVPAPCACAGDAALEPLAGEPRARARAMAIADEARDAVARAFAALDPARRLERVFAAALTGDARATGLAAAFNGRSIVLRHAGDEWSWREDVEGAAWQPAGNLPLGVAINAAGPWGRVTLPEGAPPAAGASLGRRSWNSAATEHPGPVLVQGGRVAGVTSQGSGAPALWFDGCEIVAGSGAKAAVDVHMGVKLGTPWAFTDCTFGAVNPAHRGWGRYPMMWGVRAYAHGPLAFVRCRFLEHTSEHSIYASNIQGALWVAHCEFEPSPRTNVQITNRVREGPPGRGPVAIAHSRLAIARKQHGGPGGGGSVTVAGHHGPVALLDLDFETGASEHPWDSHNSLVVVWGEPTPGSNGGAHLLPDGFWTPELAVAGLQLTGGSDDPYMPDREAVMLSAVREVWFEAPPRSDVPVRGFGGTGVRAGRILVNAHDPAAPGQNVHLGVLHWDGVVDEPWWHVVGRDWAASLAPRPVPGDYAPAADGGR